MSTSGLYMYICAPAYVCKHNTVLVTFLLSHNTNKSNKDRFTLSQFKVQPIMVEKLRKKEQLVTLCLQLR